MESGPCRGLSQLWVVHGGQFFVLLCVYSPVKTRYYGPFVAPVVVRQYRSAVLTLISVQCQIALLTRK